MAHEMRIPTPCGEDWTSMKIGVQGRFCERCTKEVMDFTSYDRIDLLAYVLSKEPGSVCGKVRRDQLDFSNYDYLVRLSPPRSSARSIRLPFVIYAVGTMIIVGCQTPYNHKNVASRPDFPRIELATAYQRVIKIPKKSLHQTPGISFDHMTERTLGVIVTEPSFLPTLRPTIAALFAEKMPEFPGGLIGLSKYMNEQISFPKIIDDDFKGKTVVVNFIVDCNGRTKFPEIADRTFYDDYFEEKMIAAIQNMPAWKPGEEKGKPLEVQLSLPIQFPG